MERDAKIYVAGHNGLVGSALMRRLDDGGYHNVVTRSSKELDLRSQSDVDTFFSEEKPDYVILAAAKVGGIGANMTYPADFIYDNLMISANVINSAYKHGVKKLMFLGSSCIYPRECGQPIHEEYLLNGYLEPTNEPYAIAKITGIKLCESYNRQYGTKFISCMPTNLYGPQDNFNLETSHVLPALLSKFVKAKENGDEYVEVWGTGTVKREFLFVDDLADAIVYLMNHYEGNEHVNVGTGIDLTIAELAELIKNIVGYKGELVYDKSKPDGTPQKLLCVDKINGMGWHAKTSLEEGLRKTLDWYRDNVK
ncbi:MAG: GDP-L-fucose synthase [Chlamydiota bacterium]|nr:GDP-L-fucose synthase [Chlamydiota bacterium]